MKDQNEYEKRCKAIQLYNEGVRFKEIIQLVGRSNHWLCKWIRRYKEQGINGLRDQSRAPQRVWRKAPERIVKEILSIRKELETHRTHRSAFSGIGAEVIHWELKQRGIKDVPSLSTISRILSQHGRTGKPKPKRNSNNHPYPYFKAQEMGALQQTDLVGPRHLRGTKGVIRFYSFHTLDVTGHTVFASQFRNKRTISLCRHLAETWADLGIPRISQMDNEMCATGGGRYRYSISQLVRLHLLLGIHLVFIPQGEPGRNAAIESFNGLWQERVLQRHTCPTMYSLRRTSKRFMHYYHYEKPHRGLTCKKDGTRFPGILRDTLGKKLRHLPKNFSLNTYSDTHGNLKLPISRGKVSFVRKVNACGRIEINGAPYFIRRSLEGQYVIATLFSHRKILVVKQHNKIIKSFPFPINKHIVAPLLSYTKSKT